MLRHLKSGVGHAPYKRCEGCRSPPALDDSDRPEDSGRARLVPDFRGGERVVARMCSQFPKRRSSRSSTSSRRGEGRSTSPTSRSTRRPPTGCRWSERYYRCAVLPLPVPDRAVRRHRLRRGDLLVGRVRARRDHAAGPAAPLLRAQPDPLCLGRAVLLPASRDASATGRRGCSTGDAAPPADLGHAHRARARPDARQLELRAGAHPAHLRPRRPRWCIRRSRSTGSRLRDDNDDYYVSACFSAPYKRTDLVIRAFNAMPSRRLLVVGERQTPALRRMAGPNVAFARLPAAAGLRRDHRACAGDGLRRLRGLRHRARRGAGLRHAAHRLRPRRRERHRAAARAVGAADRRALRSTDGGGAHRRGRTVRGGALADHRPRLAATMPNASRSRISTWGCAKAWRRQLHSTGRARSSRV